MTTGRDDTASEVGPAPVASFGDIRPGDIGDAPVATFGAEYVGAARDGVSVADLASAAAAPKAAIRGAGRRRAKGEERPHEERPPNRPGRAADSPDAGLPPPGSQIINGQEETSGKGRSAPTSRRRAGDRTGSSRQRPAGGPGHELDPDADPEAVARSICLRLLTDRARTRQELAQALQRKGVPDEAANAVLARYGEVGLIDDAAFAGQWVRSRHTARGLGRRAIAMELRRKGVADDVAGEALEEIDAESEEVRARQLVDRKLRGMAVDTREERAVTTRRLAGMLARKGYSSGIAYRIVKDAILARGADVDELGEAVED